MASPRSTSSSTSRRPRTSSSRRSRTYPHSLGNPPQPSPPPEEHRHSLQSPSLHSTAPTSDNSPLPHPSHTHTSASSASSGSSGSGPSTAVSSSSSSSTPAPGNYIFFLDVIQQPVACPDTGLSYSPVDRLPVVPAPVVRLRIRRLDQKDETMLPPLSPVNSPTFTPPHPPLVPTSDPLPSSSAPAPAPEPSSSSSSSVHNPSTGRPATRATSHKLVSTEASQQQQQQPHQQQQQSHQRVQVATDNIEDILAELQYLVCSCALLPGSSAAGDPASSIDFVESNESTDAAFSGNTTTSSSTSLSPAFRSRRASASRDPPHRSTTTTAQTRYASSSAGRKRRHLNLEQSQETVSTPSTSSARARLRSLVGQLVSGLHLVRHPDNPAFSLAVFVFPEVCVRNAGSYRFRFTLTRAAVGTKQLAMAESDPFDVLPLADYPPENPPTVATRLTRHLQSQGVAMYIPPMENTELSSTLASNTTAYG